MAYGVRSRNPNTGDLSLSEDSYTTVFRGKAGLVSSVQTGPSVAFVTPPFGMLCMYRIAIPTDEPPIIFITSPPGVRVACYRMVAGAGYWDIYVVSDTYNYTPEVYCFQRLRWDDGVRGGYGMIIWGGDGRPVFSSNRLMLNPRASLVAGVPASNNVQYPPTGNNTHISNTTQSTGWPPGTGVPGKPAIMFFAPNFVTVGGGQPSTTGMCSAATVWGDRVEVGWASLSWTSRAGAGPAIGGSSAVVSLIDGSAYD